MITLTINDVNSLLSRLDTLTDEIRRLSAHSRIVEATIHAHGAAIEHMDSSLRKLQFHCPLFEAAESRKTKTGNGDTDVRESSPHISAGDDTDKD